MQAIMYNYSLNWAISCYAKDQTVLNVSGDKISYFTLVLRYLGNHLENPANFFISYHD